MVGTPQVFTNFSRIFSTKLISFDFLTKKKSLFRPIRNLKCYLIINSSFIKMFLLGSLKIQVSPPLVYPFHRPCTVYDIRLFILQILLTFLENDGLKSRYFEDQHINRIVTGGHRTALLLLQLNLGAIINYSQIQGQA